MKTIPACLALAALTVLSGCVRVPATVVKFHPRTHQLTVRSPKDVELTNLAATVGTNGVATITLGRYSSRNNAEVVNAIAAQNARTLEEVSRLGGQLVGEAAARLK